MIAKSMTEIPWQHANWGDISVEQVGEGIERQMIVGERMMVCRLRLAPHTTTPAHDHPHEQFTIVERGRALFIIGHEERIAQAGDVLHFPPTVGTARPCSTKRSC